MSSDIREVLSHRLMTPRLLKVLRVIPRNRFKCSTTVERHAKIPKTSGYGWRFRALLLGLVEYSRDQPGMLRLSDLGAAVLEAAKGIPVPQYSQENYEQAAARAKR